MSLVPEGSQRIDRFPLHRRGVSYSISGTYWSYLTCLYAHIFMGSVQKQRVAHNGTHIYSMVPPTSRTQYVLYIISNFQHVEYHVVYSTWITNPKKKTKLGKREPHKQVSVDGVIRFLQVDEAYV